MKRIALAVLALFVAHSAHADWIDPPSRPWKISANLAFPYSDFSLATNSSEVVYSMTPSMVPSLVFGWRFLNIGISKKLFNNSGPLADRYGPTDFSSFRIGVNLKYFIIDFMTQSYKGLHTGTSAGNLYQPNLKYQMTGFNGWGGISFGGDVPYSVQSYFGSVEVPDGHEFDVVGFANTNWNSLTNDGPLVPSEKAASFGDVAQLKGFKSIALNTGIGLGWTMPISERWLASAMGTAGLSFLGGSHIYEADNDYEADIGNQYGARLAVLYRNENHTWAFKGYWDRWTQSIKNVRFRGGFKGGSASYAFRF